MKRFSLFLASLLLAIAASCTLTAAEANPAATPAVPNYSPGPEYADSARMFQGVPGIERAANGRMWATWYGGGVTEDEHNYILLSTSGDDGQTWQMALVLDPDGDGPVRAFDPCLWHDPDGRLWLFWTQETTLKRGRDVGSFVTFAITTTDSANAAAKWSAPRQISPGVMLNKPTVTTDGRWLLPVALWSTEGSTRVVVSSDHGATFAELGAARILEAKSHSADEHMIVERQDGSLWMLVRGKFPPGTKNFTGLGESVSTDGGKTWADVTASAIPHPVSRFFIRRLASGRLLLVRHQPPVGVKGRSHLTAFLSEDDGRTWKGGLLLDERDGVSYPDGVQAADGSIDVIYDYQRGRDKEILLAVFTEKDVLEGKLSTPTSRLRVRVNQATGVNPKVPANAPRVVANPNADGVALIKGPAAGLEQDGGEIDVLQPGAKLFANRNYTVNEVPEALRGWQFVRQNLGNIRVVCRQPGLVTVITPSTGRDHFSQQQALVNLGFQKVNLPELRLFSGVLCSVFQKQMSVGETLELGSWGVLIAPRKD